MLAKNEELVIFLSMTGLALAVIETTAATTNSPVQLVVNSLLLGMSMHQSDPELAETLLTRIAPELQAHPALDQLLAGVREAVYANLQDK